MTPAAPYLSVVVPCFNEEAGLDTLHARLARVGDSLGVRYELVFVNDGSRDGTWTKMVRLAADDPQLVCVQLSRNHGQQLALTAGLSVCRGDHVLVLDADLQDPPELLPRMFDLLEQSGADVVYGQRSTRPGETGLKRATSFVFYRLLGWLTDAAIPADTGDFRLMTRRVVDQFLAMPERTRFVRGMLSWVGFQQVALRYDRSPRTAGRTRYTPSKLYRLAWDAVTGFSMRPLAGASVAGGMCGVAAVLAWALAAWWGFTHSDIPTAGLLAGLILTLTAGQLLAIGVIGEYLGRTYSEVRGRPLFVVDEVIRGRAHREARPLVPQNSAGKVGTC